MTAHKKRNKVYRPRPVGDRLLRTQPWKVRNVFQPLEDILNQMEATGFSDADQRGTPIFKSLKDSCWYTSAEAINGVADAYEIHAARCGRAMPVDALRRVANKLFYGSVVFESELTEMRTALGVLRAETLGMTENYAHDLLMGVKIKTEIERASS